jgi:prohibitin 2
MSQDPRETLRKLQQTLQQRTRNGFGGSGGMPGGAQARPLAALILLGIGGYIVSNSIFNGRYWFIPQ